VTLAAALLATLAVPPVASAAETPWPPRPKFQVALGLGASVDHNPPSQQADRTLTAFFFAAGLGDGTLAVDVRAFANGATAMQVTRLALELVAVLRPLEPTMRQRAGYGPRVLRTASIDIGPSVERVSLGPLSSRRLGVMGGLHVDLPVGEAGLSKEMRVRLGVRRLRAASTMLAETRVEDSTLELYGQLAFVF
jgi:hypothetical protein